MYRELAWLYLGKQHWHLWNDKRCSIQNQKASQISFFPFWSNSMILEYCPCLLWNMKLLSSFSSQATSSWTSMTCWFAMSMESCPCRLYQDRYTVFQIVCYIHILWSMIAYICILCTLQYIHKCTSDVHQHFDVLVSINLSRLHLAQVDVLDELLGVVDPKASLDNRTLLHEAAGSGHTQAW